MDIPPSGMIDHFDPNPYKPPDYRVYGRLDALAPECRIPNHVEQIAGKTSDWKPCLIGCEAMATSFVPSEGLLALFYPVFELSPTVVNRNHLVRFEIRIGHNKTDTREELTNMAFGLTDNPSGLLFMLGICKVAVGLY